MFNSFVKKSKSSIRSFNDDDVSEQRKNKSILSFDDDEGEEPTAYKMKKSLKTSVVFRSSEEKPKQQSLYTQEHLEELRMSSKGYKKEPSVGDAIEAAKQVRIPDSAQIVAAKKLREQRKNMNETGKQKGSDALLVYDSTGSRLMTEEQEIEGEEAFDDHKGAIISFATHDAASVKKSQAKAIQDSLMEDVDEESNQWELQQIQKGIPLQIGKQPEPSLNIMPIPEMVSIPTVAAIQLEIDSVIHSLESEYKEHAEQLQLSLKSIPVLQSSIATINNDLTVASAKHDFFQQTLVFVNTLASFLEDKMQIIESLESDIVQLRSIQTAKTISDRFEALDRLFDSFCNRNYTRKQQDVPEMPSRTVDDIIDEHLRLFDDAQIEFTKFKLIAERFMEWHSQYTAEYSQAYVTLSLHQVAELYIRNEMFGWNPFATETVLDSMAWHQQVVSVCEACEDSLLLVRIIDKLIVPRLSGLVECLYDPFCRQATVRLESLMKQVLNYVDKSSQSFQLLLGTVTRRLKSVLDEAADHVTTDNAHQVPAVHDNAAISCKKQWINQHIDLLENIVALGRYIDKTTINQYVVTVGINCILLKPLESSLSWQDDIQHYQQIMERVIQRLNVVSDGDYTTPSVLKPLEQAFVSCVVVPATNSDKNSGLMQLIVTVLMGLRSLDQASRLSKLM